MDVEHNGTKIKLLLITKRNDIPTLFGVNWLKQLPITINKILLDKGTDQSETIHTKYKKLFETNHALHNAQVKIQIKTRMLFNTTNSTANTLPPTRRCEK